MKKVFGLVVALLMFFSAFSSRAEIDAPKLAGFVSCLKKEAQAVSDIAPFLEEGDKQIADALEKELIREKLNLVVIVELSQNPQSEAKSLKEWADELRPRIKTANQVVRELSRNLGALAAVHDEREILNQCSSRVAELLD